MPETGSQKSNRRAAEDSSSVKVRSACWQPLGFCFALFCMLATFQFMHKCCAVMAEHAATQYLKAQHSTARHGTARHGTARHGTARHRTAQHSIAQHGMAQHSTSQHSTAQHSAAQHSAAQRSTAQHRVTCYPVGSGAHEQHSHGCTSIRSCVNGRSLLA